MSRETSCVVLLSGGLDSTVMLYWIKERYDKVYPLYINYGSTHKEKEFAAAKETCKDLDLTLEEVTVSGNIFSGSSLVDKSVKMPDDLKDDIDTVVPFRNLIMISLAACYADKVDAGVIATSPTAEDYEVFRDCRREFHDFLESALMKAAKFNQFYQILTPFIKNTKEDVIRIGVDLDVDFAKTWTCYDPKGDKPCGVCPSCQVRAKGFKEAGIIDPLIGEK